MATAIATSTRTRRSPEDWEGFAREILPHLQSGKTFEDFRRDIGSNGDTLKTALARLGFDSRGEPIEIRKITSNRKPTLAKRVAEERRKKTPWWKLKVQADMTYGELIRLLHDHGFDARGNSTANGDSPERDGATG